MAKLLIKNGHIIDPASGHDGVADLLIEDGIVSGIGANLSSLEAEVFDATGMYVAPGFLDIHVHLREPGAEKVPCSGANRASRLSRASLHHRSGRIGRLTCRRGCTSESRSLISERRRQSSPRSSFAAVSFAPPNPSRPGMITQKPKSPSGPEPPWLIAIHQRRVISSTVSGNASHRPTPGTCASPRRSTGRALRSASNPHCQCPATPQAAACCRIWRTPPTPRPAGRIPSPPSPPYQPSPG